MLQNQFTQRTITFDTSFQISECRMYRAIGLNMKEGPMIKKMFQIQPLIQPSIDRDQVNSLLAHLSEISPLQLKGQTTLAQRYHADRLIDRNINPNSPPYNAATYKPLEVNPHNLSFRAIFPSSRQVIQQFPSNEVGTSSFFRENPNNIGTHEWELTLSLT